MKTQPFSFGWTIASVVIFTALEIAIATLIAPMVFASRLASPMAQISLQMLMHLGSFYLGGLLVGVISPGVRLLEPAVGAFVAVAIVFTMSFFMPNMFMQWEWHKVLIGGSIAFGLSLMGAYTGERWMGNVPEESSRAQLRDRLWGSEGMLSRGDERFLTQSRSKDAEQR